MKGGCRLFAIELYKLFRSKYIFAVLSVLLIPLLTAITLYTNEASFKGPLNQSALVWLNTQLFGAAAFFIAPITFAVIGSCFFAREIENKSINLYIHKVNSRKALYSAKAMAVVVFSTIVYLGASLIIILSYYVMVVNTSVGSGEFFGRYNVLESTVNIFISYLYNCIIITSIGMSMSVYLKAMPSIGIIAVIGIAIQFILTQSQHFISKFSPWLYMVILINKIDTANPMVPDYSILMEFLLKNIFITVACGGMAYIIGVRGFIKRDL